MKKSILLTTLLLFMFLGCTKTPITGRNQMIMMNSDEEMKLGLDTSKEILEHSRLSRDKEVTELLKRVGKNIALVTNRDYNTTNYQWEFNLIDNPKEANAFCLPGGKIFVFTGIFSYMDSDDELAAVIGHEVGHALARHGAERKSSATLSKIGVEALQVLNELDDKKSRIEKDADNQWTEKMAQRWIMLPHSRTQEYEADHIGLVLSAKAGYNPNAALRFWEKFSALKSNRPEYTSTHPTAKHRIEKIKELIPSVMPYYEASEKKNISKVKEVKKFIPLAVPFFKD